MMSAENLESVLVIDDEPSVRRALARMLQRIGYTAIEAADGVEALRIYRERPDEIVAATVDLMMPRMDGPATLEMLTWEAPRLPIVVCSGNALPAGLLGRGPGSLGVGYLRKPFPPNELAVELKRVIAEMRSAPPSEAGTQR